MKAMKQGWVAFILTLMPLTVSAQEHVEQAFNDFLKSKNISFKENIPRAAIPKRYRKKVNWMPILSRLSVGMTKCWMASRKR